MADLRSVKAELEAKRKEAAALERELRRAEAEPLVEVVKQAILDDEAACEFLCSLGGKEAVRIIGKLVAESLPDAEEECAADLEQLRQKKNAKAARRKERQEKRAGTAITVASENAEGETLQALRMGGSAESDSSQTQSTLGYGD